MSSLLGIILPFHNILSFAKFDAKKIPNALFRKWHNFPAFQPEYKKSSD
jgi:hypothetical protein